MKIDSLRLTIDEIFSVNHFDLEEYQDKYYFQKKVKEIFPVFTENEIYKAIDSSLPNKVSLSKKDYIVALTNELYKIFLAKKGNDTRIPN